MLKPAIICAIDGLALAQQEKRLTTPNIRYTSLMHDDVSVCVMFTVHLIRYATYAAKKSWDDLVNIAQTSLVGSSTDEMVHIVWTDSPEHVASPRGTQ